ncbi:MAG: hypothetical protein ABIK48_00400 [candidate division WOR-3 bacterium]
MKVNPETRLLFLITGAALLIRLLVGLGYKNRMTPGEPVQKARSEAEYLREPYLELGDSQQYLLLAENLRTRGRFSWNGGPVTFRLPGYPLLLALINNNLIVMTVLQAVLSAMSVLFAGRAGMKVFGPVAGLVGAGLLAIDIPNIAHCGMVMSEPLFVFLVTGALLALSYGREWLCGTMLGMAAMTRPIGVFLFLPVAVFLVWKRVRWQRVAVFLVCFGLLPGCWVVRNWRVWGRPGFSSNGGYNLFYAGAAEVVADKLQVPLAHARVYLVERYQQELEGDNPLELGERLGRIGMRVIVQEPVRFLKVYLRSAGKIIFGTKADDLVLRLVAPELRLARLGALPEVLPVGVRMVIFLLSGLELVLMGGTIFFLFRALLRAQPRSWVWLLLTLGVYFILLAAPLGDGRFRVPAMPFFTALAGAGWSGLLAKRRGG